MVEDVSQARLQALFVLRKDSSALTKDTGVCEWADLSARLADYHISDLWRITVSRALVLSQPEKRVREVKGDYYEPEIAYTQNAVDCREEACGG